MFSNSHFINSPLLGGTRGNNTNPVEDYHGLLISISSREIKFWLITPNQYLNIYNISLNIDKLNPMIKETISLTEVEERKQKLRKYIFVEPDSINSNIGVIQGGNTSSHMDHIKVNDLVSFDLDLNSEIGVGVDDLGNFIIFK